MTTMRGLRTVKYAVSDLAKAKAWYAEAFGVEPYFDELFYVGFDIDGYELGLDPDPAGVTVGNNTVAYWGTDDVDAAYTRLLSLGATEHHAPQDVGGGIRLASVRDPFGNVLGIIVNPHFRARD